MEIPIKIEFDGEKLKELVEQAVDNLIAQGYIWREEEEEETANG